MSPLRISTDGSARRLMMWLAAVVCVLAGPVAVLAAASTPEYVLPPEVVGSARLGERLVCSSGTWKGTPKFEYEWAREGIEIAYGPTYTLRKEDEHKEVWCIVTATQGGVSAYAESVNSICLSGGCHEVKEEKWPPENEIPPNISGTPAVGNTLTCEPGKWRGTPTPTFTDRWLRGNEAIKGAENSTYEVREEDAGHSLSCKVTASNSAGESSALSSEVNVPGEKPRATESPKVLGTAAAGETLTCYEGTWSGSQPITFEFQWLLNEQAIALATGPTYLVVATDEGGSLSCKVTARNSLGKAQATSEAVTIKEKPFEATRSPVVTGTAKQGETLTCSEAVWSQTPTKEEFHWWRGESGPSEPISGAKQHTVSKEDVGMLLYCQVLASNGKGDQASATSAAFPIPALGAPKNQSPPQVEGRPELGQTLTCQHGNWNPTPSQYVYQWYREGTAIPSGTEAQYTVAPADQGYLVSCDVIARNSEGASAAAESEGRYIYGVHPKNTVPPEVVAASQSPRVGESLSCLRGEWEGAPPPTFTYEWLRDGVDMGSSAAAYTIMSADRGHSLSCEVTATNPEGLASAGSSNSVYIPGSEPEATPGWPKISGEPTVGSILICNEGVWTGVPAPSFTFQWLLNGAVIPSETKSTLSVKSAYRGSNLSCRVTGSNDEGERSVTSAGVHVPGEAPKVVGEPPYIAGSGAVGRTLICERGIWTGKPPPSFAYQWYRDGTPIASSTEAEYTVEPADQEHLLSCNVIATNSEGSAEAESINGVPIASHVAQGGVLGTTTVKPPASPSPPSRAVILGSLKRQLTTVLSGARLQRVRRAKGFSFSFTPPWEGTLQVLWYRVLNVKGVHGASGSRPGRKHLVLARAKRLFAHATKGRVRLTLTAYGRRELAHKRRMRLEMKVAFALPHQKPVAWHATLVLSGAEPKLR
jgi:hypothetical protein